MLRGRQSLEQDLGQGQGQTRAPEQGLGLGRGLEQLHEQLSGSQALTPCRLHR